MAQVSFFIDGFSLMEDYNLFIFYIRAVKSCLRRGKMTFDVPACSQNVLNLKRFFILTSR